MSERRWKSAARLGVVAFFVFAAAALPSQAKTDDAASDAQHGKELFQSLPCGSCHTLKDAGATGQVGPSLDGDANLSQALIVSRLTNGQGAMPAFGDQLSEQDIADISAYLLQAAAK